MNEERSTKHEPKTSIDEFILFQVKTKLCVALALPGKVALATLMYMMIELKNIS
jgi:hypothetical protein